MTRSRNLRSKSIAAEHPFKQGLCSRRPMRLQNWSNYTRAAAFPTRSSRRPSAKRLACENAARRPIMDKDRYIEKMGVALGTQFCALWEQVVWLHMKWADFVELFGKKQSRIVVLDQAAPAFFQMIRDVLWDDMLLHIARLVDRPKKDLLTIRSLPRYVKDAVTKSAVEKLIKTAKHETEFCRKPRNTLIAHTNIVVLTTAVLQLGSRLQMTEALHALGNVLNEMETFYMGSPT